MSMDKYGLPFLNENAHFVPNTFLNFHEMSYPGDMIRLYIDDLRLSPYTYTVNAALKEKGIAFDLVPIRFEKGKSLDPGFARLSPTELIPFFVDGDLKLSESLAMLEYIEETHPSKPILPKDLKTRAQARMLLSWYRCGMTALRNERSAETLFYSELRSTTPLSEEAKEEVRDLTKHLKALLKPGATFLFGEWSIADHETALMLQRLIRNGDEIDSDLKAYANKIWERPSAKEWVEFKRPAFKSYYR